MLGGMLVPHRSLALGGAWLAAQAFPDARRAALAALELGYGAILPAPSARLFPWQDLREATEDLPLSIPAIRVDPPFEAAPGSLASSRADEVLAVRSRVERAAQLARHLGLRRLILEVPQLVLSREAGPETSLEALSEPDPEAWPAIEALLSVQRDAALDRSCRNLHRLLHEFPDFEFCLSETADLASLSRASDLAAIFEDLAGEGRLAYWQRSSLAWYWAKMGDVGVGERLEMLSKYLVGMDLEDYAEHGARSVPGSGPVDYALLAPYMKGLQRRLPLCLEPDPACRAGDVRQGRAFLGNFGL